MGVLRPKRAGKSAEHLRSREGDDGGKIVQP